MSKIFLLCIYHTSYFPLWISIVFIDFLSLFYKSDNVCTEIISIICIVTSNVFAYSYIKKELRKLNNIVESTMYKILSAKEEKTITTEFLLTYILPLFTFDFTKWDGVVLFLIFYLFIAFLSLFHNEFIPSIVFEFFKFRFYNCTIKTSDDIKLERKILSRNRLNLCNGEEVYLKHINNECSIDVTPRDSVS